jgi:hypothetical protein
MRLDYAYNDIDAAQPPCRAFGQHFVGLAHAGGGAEEYLELAAAFLRRLAQEGFGRGAPKFIEGALGQRIPPRRSSA